MDEAEQAKAYAQADFSVAHESFVDFFEEVFRRPAGRPCSRPGLRLR